MIKKLTKVGNSKALLLDKTILEQLGIRGDDRVQVTISGTSIVVNAINPRYASDAEFRPNANRIGKKYKELFRRLA
jgi:antitoxin component of MazEF toxin-antitoxin module